MSRFWLCLIFFLALVLRVGAVNFGLPQLYHADEPVVVNHALAYGTGDLNPHFFNIPPLPSYLLFGLYGLYFLTGKAFGIFKTTLDFERLFYVDPSSFYVLGRLFLGVLPGFLSVVLIYWITRRHFSKRTAYGAAALLAVCFLHVRDSH